MFVTRVISTCRFNVPMDMCHALRRLGVFTPHTPDHTTGKITLRFAPTSDGTKFVEDPQGSVLLQLSPVVLVVGVDGGLLEHNRAVAWLCDTLPGNIPRKRFRSRSADSVIVLGPDEYVNNTMHLKFSMPGMDGVVLTTPRRAAIAGTPRHQDVIGTAGALARALHESKAADLRKVSGRPKTTLRPDLRWSLLADRYFKGRWVDVANSISDRQRMEPGQKLSATCRSKIFDIPKNETTE